MFYGIINNDKDYVTFESSFYQVDDNEILNEADASRKAILNGACKTVNRFLNSNGIRIESRKAFRNGDFKKGKTNEIKFYFAAKFLPSFLIGMLFSVIVQMIYMVTVEQRYLPMIAELFKDKKKVAELNNELKEVGNIKVKGYNKNTNELTLIYTE